jgi:hypothetical protein
VLVVVLVVADGMRRSNARANSDAVDAKLSEVLAAKHLRADLI